MEYKIYCVDFIDNCCLSYPLSYKSNDKSVYNYVSRSFNNTRNCRFIRYNISTFFERVDKLISCLDGIEVRYIQTNYGMGSIHFYNVYKENELLGIIHFNFKKTDKNEIDNILNEHYNENS